VPQRLEEYYEVLAHHYGRSGNKDKASAMEEAKRYFDDAMTLLDNLPETECNQRRCIALLVNQPTVILLLNKYPEYYDLLTRYEAMAVRVGDQGLLGAFYTGLGWGEYGFGHFNQAIQTLAKAAECCEAAGNLEDAGLAYVVWEWSYMWKGDYDQVLILKDDVLRMMAQRFNLRWYLFAVTAASLAYTALGHWDHAVEDGHKALRSGEEFSDPSVISYAAFILSWAYTTSGDLVQALEYGELGVRNALTPGNKNWAQSVLGWAWVRASEPRKGVELLAEGLAMNRSGHPADKWLAQSAHVPPEIWQLLFLGEGYWLAGESDNARRTLEELLDLANRCGAQFYLGSAHRLLGEIALPTDPIQVAVPLAASHFEQSIAILQQIHAENELALAYAGYGMLHQRQGHVEQAHDYLIRALAIFERLGTLGEPDKVRQALAELPRE
jgi:tetratricopeptide (TPR) repeat protein